MVGSNSRKKHLLKLASCVFLSAAVSSCGIFSKPEPYLLSPSVDGYFRVSGARLFPTYCSRAANECAKVSDELQKRMIRDMCVADTRFNSVEGVELSLLWGSYNGEL